MKADRAKYGSAIDLRLRVRQASRTLGGMEGLYADLREPELCARLTVVATELQELEELLGAIVQANRQPLAAPRTRPTPD